MATASIVSIARTSQWANRLRSVKVIIDGEVVGSVGDGETRDFTVSPGEHQVAAKLDWYRSRPVTVMVGPGEKAKLVCGCYAEGWKLLIAIPLSVIPGMWLYLRPA